MKGAELWKRQGRKHRADTYRKWRMVLADKFLGIHRGIPSTDSRAILKQASNHVYQMLSTVQ